MKTKTGLLALGLFTVAGMVTISCGGSSDTGDTSGTSGSTATAGTTGTGGNSTAGSTTTAGTTNNTSGTANNTGGTNNNTGGTNNNTGGTNNNNGGAPDNPGAGGAGNNQGCPATQPTNGDTCMRPQNQQGPFTCDYGAVTCACTRNGGQMRTWQCNDGMGAGGAGNGFPTATCPDNAMTGDDCSNGPGLCPGQQCFCGGNDMVFCQ